MVTLQVERSPIVRGSEVSDTDLIDILLVVVPGDREDIEVVIKGPVGASKATRLAGLEVVDALAANTDVVGEFDLRLVRDERASREASSQTEQGCKRNKATADRGAPTKQALIKAMSHAGRCRAARRGGIGVVQLFLSDRMLEVMRSIQCLRHAALIRPAERPLRATAFMPSSPFTSITLPSAASV